MGVGWAPLLETGDFGSEAAHWWRVESVSPTLGLWIAHPLVGRSGGFAYG